MKSFTAIDFETGNPQRVSACAIGFVEVENGIFINEGSYLIKPVGGHAPFQSKIHGITENDTKNQPMFDEIFPEIQSIFNRPVVGHSLFDKQVLEALSSHFGLNVRFEYYNSCDLVKERIPGLDNYKLNTIAKHLGFEGFKHHNALDDAKVCAKILLTLPLDEVKQKKKVYYSTKMELKGIIQGILADDHINYKEAYSLLYWIEDHPEVIEEHQELFDSLKDFCRDREISEFEEAILIELCNNEMDTFR